MHGLGVENQKNEVADDILGGNKAISFFFSMIFKASLLIQITNINQLCIDHFVR